MPGPEGRHGLAAMADDRHAARLQHLQRLFDVEDRLGAGRHDDDRRARQLVEIGRDVEALFRALVHAADAAGGEHLYPGHMRGDHGGGDRGAAGARLGDRKAEIGARQLHGVTRHGQRFALAVGKPDLDAAGDHGDCRRHRAIVQDDLLDIGGHGAIVWIGHAMGDDGAFQRHHRAARGQRLSHRLVDVDEGAGGFRRHVCLQSGKLNWADLMPLPAAAAQGPAPRQSSPP